tara:strand:- start:7870 stop:9162 length:1293 start_codon:yes stop_codon:yes gene_type:complete
MSKPLVLVTAPVETRSGYGNHSRDICRALIELDKYDVRINPCRWGSTPLTALEDGNPSHDKIRARLLREPKLDRQPDLHVHIVIPPEFNPIGKKNIGITAGMETTIPQASWVAGCNKMDLNIFTSNFSAHGHAKASFQAENGEELKLIKPWTVLFEGFEEEVYKDIDVFSDGITDLFSNVTENFNFLFTGHWLAGNMGEDRKDVGMLLKVFLETFKNQKNQPGLILKTSGADFSIIDREEIVDKIKQIKDAVNGKLPNIYLIHGDFTDKEMNELYNHPKVKAHITFTHGEGFGRPLLEACQSGKPVIAPDWSGQKDFLNPSFATLLPGDLTKASKSAFPKEILLDVDDNKWFTVNYNYASQLMKDVVKNYPKYLSKGKQLQYYTKTKFNFTNMKNILDKQIDKLLADLPKKVDLKLPKLDKVKLPKLKKD